MKHAADRVKELRDMFEDAMRTAVQRVQNAQAQEIKNTAHEDDVSEMFSFKGINQSGIEVYETSQAVKNLSWGDRKSLFMDLMTQEYRGRTAKFIRNGHAYYAKFSPVDVRKNIYGDNLSDAAGRDAKINAGASGDIFNLVENATYNGSKPEQVKDSSAHKGVGYWDYFVKKVQIDNKVFDLIENVRKKQSGEYVYSLQLNEDKKTKATPPENLRKAGGFNGAQVASADSIAQQDKSVNKNRELGNKKSVQDNEVYSLKDSEGTTLTKAQQDFFHDSKARDKDGNLLVLCVCNSRVWQRNVD